MWFLLVICFNCYSTPKALEVRIAVPHLLLENFLTVTKDTPCQKLDIPAQGLGPVRGLIDLILLCKTLRLSSTDFDLRYIPTYTYKRTLRLLENGEADIGAETVWNDEQSEKFVLFSDAVVPAGVFTKGLYTLPNHPLQKLDQVQDKINSYSAVAREHWKYDWEKLLQITPFVTNASSYQATFKMLAAGRADFTLMEFSSSSDLSVTVEGVYMVPIKNVKVVIPIARHFAVSRNSKSAKFLINTLNSGIDKLNISGIIVDAYSTTGFYKEEVKNWISL